MSAAMRARESGATISSTIAAASATKTHRRAEDRGGAEPLHRARSRAPTPSRVKVPATRRADTRDWSHLAEQTHLLDLELRVRNDALVAQLREPLNLLDRVFVRLAGCGCPGRGARCCCVRCRSAGCRCPG